MSTLKSCSVAPACVSRLTYQVHGLSADVILPLLTLLPITQTFVSLVSLTIAAIMLSPIAAATSQHLSMDSNTLQQYGFGPDVTFDGLLSGNPFLYRVYTPRSQNTDTTNPFVANKFNDDCSFSLLDGPSHLANSSTYADVVQHMDWTTRSTSPFISTSFSFAWAIWEAIRRYHTNVKHDVEIAVIDAKAVTGHAVTATELLMKGKASE